MAADPEVVTRYSTRDTVAERAALGRLQRSGFNGPDAQGKLQLLGQNGVLNFFAREFTKLQREWTVSLDEQLENRTLKTSSAWSRSSRSRRRACSGLIWELSSRRVAGRPSARRRFSGLICPDRVTQTKEREDGGH